MAVFDVHDFGAVGNGSANDFNAVQATITAAAAGRGRVRISGGIYAIDRSLNIPSNSTLEWDDGVLIVAKDCFVGEAMLVLRDARHITLDNPRLDGNKAGNSGAGAQGFYGIMGDRTSHVRVLGGYITNLPAQRDTYGSPVLSGSGDAIYLTDAGGSSPAPCDYWVIRDTMMADCDRNGLSVISARFSKFDGLTVVRCGHAGIDIEPNNMQQRVVALLVRNCVLNDNSAFGLVLYHPQTPYNTTGHIAVVGNSIEQNRVGVHVQSFAPVSLVANVIRNNTSFGVILLDTLSVNAVGNIIDDTHGNHVSVINTNVTQSANIGWSP